MSGEPRPVDPPGMPTSPAFAQGMIAPAGPLLFVGGQNGIDSSGTLLDGMGPQSEQALRNVLAVRADAGSTGGDRRGGDGSRALTPTAGLARTTLGAAVPNTGPWIPLLT